MLTSQAIQAFQAFSVGILSACSLLFGAITSAIWKPSNKTLAFLIAFGGGALLAAITLDLVVPALEEGQFYALTVGCLIGSFLFLSLNQLINNYGGFLRKDATTAQFIRTRREQKFKEILKHIGRIDVFQKLSSEEVEKLAKLVFSRRYKEGTRIYHANEPSEGLYIIEKGVVELLDPRKNFKSVRQLQKNDAFGRLAYLTGSPHTTIAVAKTDTQLWILPKQAFEQLLNSSPTFVEALTHFFQGEETVFYLRERQQMNPQTIQQWIKQAINNIQTQNSPQNAINVKHKRQKFKQNVTQIKRLPIFQALPPEEIQYLAEKIFCKQHPKGHTFFRQFDPSERMYILEKGEVALIKTNNQQTEPLMLRQGDIFGGMSFLTGTAHSATAIATAPTTVWIIRREDFNELLPKCPQLEQSIKDFLQQPKVLTYLRKQQHFDSQKAAQWTRKVLKAMGTSKFIPSVAEMVEEIKEHSDAPTAIWLGLMLDDLPDALVLGSSLVSSGISVALIAGLFISNYPEALSSSVGMRQQGFSWQRVFLMWSSLMLFTGLGTILGSFFFNSVPLFVLFLMKGIAVGSVLTMISETMLPEAYFKESSVVGFSTLMGFLTTTFFKSLETNFHSL